MALGTGPLAGLTLRRSDPLGVPLFGEHPFREIQPLLDIGEPPLHVLECVEPRLNVLAPPYPLLQLVDCVRQVAPGPSGSAGPIDRKSTRLNSSHGYISYAVFCLK